jgi:hypothetical protein
MIGGFANKLLNSMETAIKGEEREGLEKIKAYISVQR